MGTITLSYFGTPNGEKVSLSTSAEISDADAVIFLGWAQNTLQPYGDVSNADSAFKAVGSKIIQQMIGEVLDWEREQAVEAAKQVVPISIKQQ